MQTLNLLLNYPTFKSNDEADELIKTVKSLYIEKDQTYESFTEFQKSITIKALLERYIRKDMENNMFRYGKISNRDDDDWYHFIKEVSMIELDDDFMK